MIKCIVRKEGEFEVISYEYPDSPSKLVMTQPVAGYPSNYVLVEKKIEIVWNIENNLRIIFEDLVVDSYETDNIMQVCDYINKYNSMGNNQLSEIIRLKRRNILNQYIIKVDNYKKELEQLKSEVIIYTKIIQKKQELTKLIQQLEN